MSDNTPTTDEIREYVEMGGEPSPWLPPTPEKDAMRVAAFDRWLTAHDAEIRRDQIEKDAGIAGVRWDAMFETDQGYRVAKLTGERVALAIRDQLAGDEHE